MLRLVCLAAVALADLPVHCLRHQVVGEWEFRLGPPSPQRTSCGHRRPDSDVSEPQPQEMPGQRVVKVALSDPNTATIIDDGGVSLIQQASDSYEGMNTWTMIYDEAFEVRTGGLNLFSFSRFDLHIGATGQKVNVSHCDATMVGWYHDEARSSWGCWHGQKASSVQPDALAGVPAFTNALAPEPVKSASYDAPLDFGWHQGVADKLNLLQTGWTATVYDKYVGKTPRELNKMMGIRRTTPISSMGEHGRKQLSFLEQGARSGTTNSLKSRTYDHKLAMLEKDMPETLDWRNKDGTNYLEPVMDQGDCGSCYVVSTMRMLSARNKIRTAQPDALPFSISFPLFCAEYNQGCDGGYAFLTSKWSEDVGLIPATCARYETNGQCSISCSEEELGPKLRATNHRYIGGYYGGSSAAEIMQELQNGPVVVSLEPKSDLMYYQGGVYESTPDEVHQEWERVDHAVLLIGYGEEGGKKYWQLQNSWGGDWGEHGFFRMARGINDSGVESIAVAADVTEDSSSGVSDFLRQSAVLF